jgi:uncharacterized protein
MRNVVVTRVQHKGLPKRSRNLEERLMVLFPGVYRRGAARLLRLDPRSRLRRALLLRAVVSGWAAGNRRDFKLMLVRYAPDVEFEFSTGQQTLGLDTFRGHAGMIDMLGRLDEVWGSWELEAAYLLDLGDRVLVLGFLRIRGKASGVELEQEYAQLITVREGLVAHDQNFYSWKEGLRAGGLDPDAITLPARGSATA